MKVRLLAILAGVLMAAALLALIEGVHSLAKGSRAHLSLSYQALLTLGLAGEPKTEAVGAYAPYFTDIEELSDLAGLLIESGVGVGNTPFEELRTEAAAMNTKTEGCVMLKPNLRKVAFFLRTPPLQPFDPVTVFYDADKKLDARLTAFFDRYGTPPAIISTNAEGERVTLPSVERPRKVIVAGDSVAFGAMIEDGDTLSSQLQARDPLRQYVNLGVAGTRADHIVCRLEAELRRYAGQVDELIYVYCENDFNPKFPYGTPEEVVAWLQGFAAREKIAKVTVVYAPYIYTIAPEITRLDGYFGETFPQHAQEREALMKAVEAAGFGWVDIGTLARQQQVERDSPFGFFALFVDRLHLSPEGVALLADQLVAP